MKITDKIRIQLRYWKQMTNVSNTNRRRTGVDELLESTVRVESLFREIGALAIQVQ